MRKPKLLHFYTKSKMPLKFKLNRSNNSSKAPEYKLTYFNCRGRGELTRLIFAKSETSFEDERVEFDAWPERKASTPMGHLPVLKYKDLELTQSLTISRFVAKKCKLAGKSETDEFLADEFVTAVWTDIINQLAEIFHEKDETVKENMIGVRRSATVQNLDKLCNLVKGEYVLGKVLSYADLALLDVEAWVALCIPDIQIPVKLAEVIKRVKTDKQVSAYLAERPPAAF